MSLHSVFRAVFALVCAAMLGLAAGAVWMVAALYAGHATSWLALPFAVVLAWTIRHWVQSPGRYAAVLAALAALLAALYVNVLMASALIVSDLGVRAGIIVAPVAVQHVLWPATLLAIELHPWLAQRAARAAILDEVKRLARQHTVRDAR